MFDRWEPSRVSPSCSDRATGVDFNNCRNTDSSDYFDNNVSNSEANSASDFRDVVNFDTETLSDADVQALPEHFGVDAKAQSRVQSLDHGRQRLRAYAERQPGSAKSPTAGDHHGQDVCP